MRCVSCLCILYCLDVFVDQGYLDITKSECTDVRGCCWAADNESLPKCYKKNCDIPKRESCDPNFIRIACGFRGIKKNKCENMNCCWDDGEAESGKASCYFKNKLEESSPEEELDPATETEPVAVKEAEPCSSAEEKETKATTDPVKAENPAKLEMGAFGRSAPHAVV